MTEATHVTEGVFGLLSGIGRGAKIWAGFCTISDGETIDTGLDEIEGISGVIISDAAVDSATSYMAYSAISGGTITFESGKIDDYSAVADETCSFLVVGYVK